jgi:ribosomal protein S18 acetylase RimI-like enzyme
MAVLPEIGFKLVDRDLQVAHTLLAAARHEGRPLELGLYFGDSSVRRLLSGNLPTPGVRVNAHTDHRRLTVDRITQVREDLIRHVDRVQPLGSRYSIIHLSTAPLAQRRAFRQRLFDALLEGLIVIEGICETADYAVYVENTFEGLDFYAALFDAIRHYGLRRIHFCFDMGHAKVWSQETAGDWLGFLESLRAVGIRLHFHLHNNRGLTDDHLAFHEAAAEGFNQPDQTYIDRDYREWVGLLSARFPDVSKILEVKPELACADIRYLRAALSRPALDWDPIASLS